jgi:hypothetical protein
MVAGQEHHCPGKSLYIEQGHGKYPMLGIPCYIGRYFFSSWLTIVSIMKIWLRIPQNESYTTEVQSGALFIEKRETKWKFPQYCIFKWVNYNTWTDTSLNISCEVFMRHLSLVLLGHDQCKIDIHNKYDTTDLKPPTKVITTVSSEHTHSLHDISMTPIKTSFLSL